MIKEIKMPGAVELSDDELGPIAGGAAPDCNANIWNAYCHTCRWYLISAWVTHDIALGCMNDHQSRYSHNVALHYKP